MKICFELSMPNRASWNGRWSGENDLYAKVVNFSNSKAGNAIANKILEHKSYYHRWNDGWGALISVREVDSKESASIKRRSKGFCGYDWMIDNIRAHGSCYDKKPDQNPAEKNLT
jgi:hypothetical protein